jgi:hypothetical protein
MVELQEGEDEGACYAFQLDDDQILFISGQDYYSSSQFPNSDFSLNQILDDQGRLLEELISKQGEKLQPVHQISAHVKIEVKRARSPRGNSRTT